MQVRLKETLKLVDGKILRPGYYDTVDFPVLHDAAKANASYLELLGPIEEKEEKPVSIKRKKE